MAVIDSNAYFNDLNILTDKLSKIQFDAIVCIKRSGFIGGAYLSNQLSIPLFTTTEIKSIPEKFKTILLFDDKCHSGTTMRHYVYQLNTNHRRVITSVMYLEDYFVPDVYVRHINNMHSMFYEVRIKK